MHPVLFVNDTYAQEMGINTTAGVFPYFWKIMLYLYGSAV